MSTDALGNPVTLELGSVALPALDDFVQGFIASEARAVNVLSAADDPSPIVQASVAAVHMFAESAAASGECTALHRQGARGRRTARRLASSVSSTPSPPGSMATCRARSACTRNRRASTRATWPRSSWGSTTCSTAASPPAMLRLALAALPAAGDVPYLHGMLAFGWEQCHGLEQAEAHARRAIAMCRKEPWAHHALAHVMLTQGRIQEGHAFLEDVSDTWQGLNSFMVTHNWWHQALFALELDRADEVLALYDRQVWGVAKDYSQDQVNAVSLLARLELAGIDVGDRWQDLADYLAPRTADHVLPFLDLQYLLGLARAGRPQAQVLLRNIEAHAATGAAARARDLAARVRAGSARTAGVGSRRLRDGCEGTRPVAAAPAGGRRQPRPARPVLANPPRRAGAQRPAGRRPEPAAAAVAPAARIATPAPAGRATPCLARPRRRGRPLFMTTLVLLPGLAGNEVMWRDQLVALADFRPHVSDVHMRHETLTEMAAGLLSRFSGELVLCGASMGGMVAMEAARQAPARIRGLALLGTTAQPETAEMSAVREQAIALFAQGRSREVIEPNVGMAFHPDRASDAELAGRYLDFVLEAGAGQLIRQNRAVIARPDARTHLPALRCPVLVMCGEDDQLTPPELSREIAALAPGAQLVLVPRCGHMLTMEQPEAVNRELRRWLRAVLA